MPDSDKLLQRIALISDLIGKAPAGFGRTALMKCLYFLQTVRHVPLGYHFRLYTYGPFDSDVLSDLSLAERFGLVESKLSQFSGGYRYELHGGGAPTRIFEGARNFLDRYKEDVDWVVDVFGARSARDLENASTLIFIDRSVAAKGGRITLSDLARKVHDVKPHLALPLIEEEARNLREQDLVAATP
jgi:uncharacterized protein YwgA